jgi:hypothetical protein
MSQDFPPTPAVGARASIVSLSAARHCKSTTHGRVLRAELLSRAATFIWPTLNADRRTGFGNPTVYLSDFLCEAKVMEVMFSLHLHVSQHAASKTGPFKMDR